MLGQSSKVLWSLSIIICLCTGFERTPAPDEPAGPTVDTKLPRYSKAAASIKGRLRIGGGGTTERFVRPLVVEFTKLYPEVSYEITLRGIATAPTGLGNREYNVGVMSRAMTAEEEADIKKNADSDVVEVAFAADAILVLVNKDNPVEGIAPLPTGRPLWHQVVGRLQKADYDLGLISV